MDLKPKIISFYLPQFHQISENDKWWGKGFTEWRNVKNAKPLFKNHYQPRKPYNDKYYNLLNPESIKWQTEIAKKYNVYGFCFYHYWFKGRKILEKPAEILLDHKEIEFPFCFSWANHSWRRSWYGQNNEILIKQEYGDLSDWLKHIEYLIPFFKDRRYIKKNNKPVFLIFKPNDIKNIDAILQVWQKKLIQEGFGGIHIVETLIESQVRPISSLSEGVTFYEPSYTLFNENKIRRYRLLAEKYVFKQIINKFDYNKIYNEIIKRNNEYNGKKIYFSSFVDYDDTARKKYRIRTFTKANPENFKNNFNMLYKKAKEKFSDYIFITAWNEWSEGAYLEPDTKYKYKYLEAIKEVVNEKII